MPTDLISSSSSPTFMFENSDVVNMDGLLASDSNDSSSSSTENGLLHQLHTHHPHVPHHQLQSPHSLYQQPQQQPQQQQHHQYPSQPQHGPHSSPSLGHSLTEKRKLEDLSDSCGKSGDSGHKKASPANGKKTKGRVKIKMEFIDNKLRRYTTFSKRKTGIMKKVKHEAGASLDTCSPAYPYQAYELSTLTGTQVMLLVASETGHVYTFATRKLQPMITSDAGKALIQTCLNSPDLSNGATDQRMCATGFEETDLTYTVNEDNSSEKVRHTRSPLVSRCNVLCPNTRIGERTAGRLLMFWVQTQASILCLTPSLTLSRVARILFLLASLLLFLRV